MTGSLKSTDNVLYMCNVSNKNANAKVVPNYYGPAQIYGSTDKFKKSCHICLQTSKSSRVSSRELIPYINLYQSAKVQLNILFS